jgi:hypothetical protein
MINQSIALTNYIETNYPNRQANDMANAMYMARTIVLGDSFKSIFEVVDFYFAP